MFLPVVTTVVQLVTTRGRLCVEHGTVGRRIALGTHLGSMKPDLVFDLFPLLFGHSTEFDRWKRGGWKGLAHCTCSYFLQATQNRDQIIFDTYDCLMGQLPI